MRIIEPSFTIDSLCGVSPESGIRMLQYCEHRGRISHKSEDKQTEDSYKKFFQTWVCDRGDWSVTEHASFTVEFRVDRGVTHELVRHRLFGFTQESTRFVNYDKVHQRSGEGLDFIYPIEAAMQTLESGVIGYNEEWLNAIATCELTYLNLLSQGWRPQEARSILPNALASTIAVTGNLRNWRHALLMRTTRETHPDFRRVTVPLLAELQKFIPLLYDDIEPLGRQADAMRKAR